MALPNAYAQYNNSKILTASPAELTLMLYDGAIKFCNMAIMAIEQKNIEKAHTNIVKVQRIIEEFRSTLDRKYAVAEDFDRIYVYMLQRLLEANLKKDPEILEEVNTHLRSMRDNWKEVMRLNKEKHVSMMENYLRILQESLVKKLEILSQIEKKSQEQAELLKSSEVSMAAIDANMDEKAELIEKLAPLDDGFDSLYEKIKKELLANKENYKPQIAELQKLIAEVTGKSASIQAIEARNKTAVESFFREERKALQVKKNAMAAAQDYYQNMNKVKNVAPQFMDTKK